MILPLTLNTTLILNSFYSLFVIASFFIVAVEQTITLIQKAKHA